MKTRVAILAALAGVVLVACKGNTNDPIDFIVKPIKPGGDIKISTEDKGKPMVVYMWATWCGPCKQFAPILNGIADKYRPKGIEFLAISPETQKVVEQSELLEPHRMTVAIDAYGSATQVLQANALPTIVILDKEHRPVWASQGYNSGTEDEIIAALDNLQ
ncbi:MAG: TlpA family protein disulfide reductase [Armatimonadetes bacterium]|nr:TlpA family protein disulfide reductase [Armatimonadota bacterium]MBS1728825.1 TlpA family protein disulfide reductase [Armatimonadota bacterium]